MKYVPPSIHETAFNCPHCHALTTQTWFKVSAKQHGAKSPTPQLITEADDHNWDHITDAQTRAKILDLVKKALLKRPFFDSGEDDWGHPILNLNLSRCFNCSEFSIWVYDSLLFPRTGGGPPANADTPSDIRTDYEEASAILDASPRGAAALLRLCIQKLCKHLGQPGENINSDIKALVSSGVGSQIQKALDAVRVIGNHAVHPGTMDLRDDRAMAESLFRLFNLIVEKTVSEQKMVDEVYASLPPSALKQIAERDKGKS